MAKCIVCAHLNAESEHKRLSIALNTVVDGKTRRGNHKITQSLANTLRERRKQFDPKKQPHMFCAPHGGPGCSGKNTLKAS